MGWNTSIFNFNHLPEFYPLVKNEDNTTDLKYQDKIKILTEETYRKEDLSLSANRFDITELIKDYTVIKVILIK